MIIAIAGDATSTASALIDISAVAMRASVSARDHERISLQAS